MYKKYLCYFSWFSFSIFVNSFFLLIFSIFFISLKLYHPPINYTRSFARLIPFIKFKKREKHSWKSVTFCGRQAKVILFHGCFSGFLNCTNGTKSRKASHIFLILHLTIINLPGFRNTNRKFYAIKYFFLIKELNFL